MFIKIVIKGLKIIIKYPYIKINEVVFLLYIVFSEVVNIEYSLEMRSVSIGIR